MSEDGLHEIQLDGKQLVFLFMATTIVLVVTFLCGVMFGRGVRATGGSQAPDVVAVATDPTTSEQDEVRPSASSSTPSAGPAAGRETLTYQDRLSDPRPEHETLPRQDAPVPDPPPERPTPSPAAPVTTPRVVSSPVPPPVAAAPPAHAVETASSEPAGTGWVVQVAAVRERAEADVIVKRLVGKGYKAFVTTPGPGAPRVFRVRVGKYADQRQAETIANRLKKEEEFKPWVTR